MSRPAKGIELLEKAKEIMSKAKTANEMRICQAVILPLEGKSLEETATQVGRSVSWVAHRRADFIAACGMPPSKPRRKGVRTRANMTIEEETEFLNPFMEDARKGKILIVSDIHKALEERMKRHVPLSSTYNLLHRHHWRKLVPYKRHIKGDIQAQEEFKKNFLNL